MSNGNTEKDLAIRAAWLSYVGGYTQAEIAERLGVSRMKVHRLIAAAHELGAVKVFIEGEPAELIALEDALARAFDLSVCTVVPGVARDDGNNPFANIGTAAARFLRGRLEAGSVRTLGVGWGRSLAEMVNRLPQTACPALRIVPVLGSVTRKMALNPYDVVHRLTDATGGEGYLLPVPMFADTPEHRQILLEQRSVRDVYELASAADLTMVGVGAVPPQGHTLLQDLGEVNEEECRQLHEAGAEAEVVGQFLDGQGRLVETAFNQRTLGLGLDVLGTQEVIAVTGGEEKVHATLSVLRSGLLAGLVTDETVARGVLALMEEADAEEPVRQRRT